MPDETKPRSCDPDTLAGSSDNIVVSRCGSDCGAVVERLNAYGWRRRGSRRAPRR
jgi:hypothetical protein